MRVSVLAPLLKKRVSVAGVLAVSAVGLGVVPSAQAAAIVDWSPTKNYWFGDWPVAAGPSPGVVFTLRNSGDASATIQSLTVSYNAPGFVADSSAPDGCHSGLALAPGGSCTTTVSFDPSGTGAVSAVFKANFSGAPYAASLSTGGNGTNTPAPTTPEPTTPEPTTPAPTTPAPTTPAPTTPEPTTPEPTTPAPTTPAPTTPQPTTPTLVAPEPTVPEPSTPTPDTSKLPDTPKLSETPKSSETPTAPTTTTVPDAPLLLPTPNLFAPASLKFRVLESQVSATLAKVRYSLSGAPSTALVTATLRFGGKPIGSGTLPTGSGLSDARVAVSATARKALKRRTRVRLQLEVTVTNLGVPLTTKTFAVALRRAR